MRHSLNGPLAGFGLVLAGVMAGVMALPMGAALAFERPLAENSTAALFDQHLIGQQHHIAGVSMQRGGPEQRREDQGKGRAAHHPSSLCRIKPRASSTEASGGTHAAASGFNWPFSPRICAKFRT